MHVSVPIKLTSIFYAVVSGHYRFCFLLLGFMYLLERQNGREGELEHYVPSTGSLPKHLQKPGLGKTTARSLELQPGLQ